MIKQTFLHVDKFREHVNEGHYDLIGPDGEIILPQVWEDVIQPGWSISMHLWRIDSLTDRPPRSPPLRPRSPLLRPRSPPLPPRSWLPPPPPPIFHSHHQHPHRSSTLPDLMVDLEKNQPWEQIVEISTNPTFPTTQAARKFARPEKPTSRITSEAAVRREYGPHLHRSSRESGEAAVRRAYGSHLDRISESDEPKDAKISTKPTFPTAQRAREIARPKPISSVSSGEAAVRRAYGSRLNQNPESDWLEDDGHDHKGFSQRVAEAAEGEVIYPMWDGRVWALNISTMQRVNIHAIQKDLLEIANNIRKVEQQTATPNDSDDSSQSSVAEVDWRKLKELMRDYCRYPFLT